MTMTSLERPSSLEGRLLFAVPKKGRLQKQSLELLAGSDIRFSREARYDIALVKNHYVALIFLPAVDIPKHVALGGADLGITGQDQLAEYEAEVAPNSPENGLELISALNFGGCKLQVQVPITGPISHPKDLIGKTVATSFKGLTTRYFERIEEQEGILNLKKEGDSSSSSASANRQLQTKILHINGSVESACSVGLAQGVVDLVDSGDTMRAHDLKAIDTLLESTAVLIKPKELKDPSHKSLVDLIATRINGVITAQKYVLCQYNIPRPLLQTATTITPGKRAPTITALYDSDWMAVSAMVEVDRIATVMDDLLACGATDILVIDIENSRSR